MSEFRDQVVLITGATGALGEIVTSQFLDAGAHVVGVDLDWSQPPVSQRVRPIVLDLVDPEQCRRAVNMTLEQHHRIDILLHLVGGYATGTTIAETPDDVWQRMMNMNLHSTFNLCRAVLPHMMAMKRGRIIAIGAKAGVDPVSKMGAYHVSKSAMHSLIRAIGRECRGSGVTANAILPSIIDTVTNRTAMPEADYSKWVTPRVIAQLITYLASEASADINGSLIPIYGRA
ncbi:MAG TPA: SDR family NAD(P)-dependent oxidoreductase [Bryobacteraceae bacterium]|nr:SDR family NAD(P)-dependent oxidoreductase [Bryobacteraceae bacterium]